MKIILTCLFFIVTPHLIASPFLIEAGIGVTPLNYSFNNEDKSYLQIENELFVNWDFTNKWSASSGIAYSQAQDKLQSVTTETNAVSTYLSLSFHENNYRLSSSIQMGQDAYHQNNPTPELDIPITQDKNEHFQIDISYHQFLSFDDFFIGLGSGLNAHQSASQSVEDYKTLTDIYNAHYIDQWKNNRLLLDFQLSSTISRLFIINNASTIIPSVSWHYTLNIFERNQSLFESKIQNESDLLDSEYILDNDFGSQQNTLTARIQYSWRNFSMNLSSSVDIEALSDLPISLRCYWQHQF